MVTEAPFPAGLNCYDIPASTKVEGFGGIRQGFKAGAADEYSHPLLLLSLLLVAAMTRAGADFTYLIVALIGAGVTGGLLYVVLTELFSSSSPSKIYGNAFEKCRIHPEVIGAFGEPIKAFGETTRRGRRQHVASTEYFKDGIKCLRLKFYISGSEPRLQGVVHVDLKENPESKKYEFQYIIVEVDTIPRRSIIVEDNRHMH
ncbi:unnamed protein product [Ranitomeya imitator]|uniref:Mitochondrial import inner membrane translocase subunit Tim21 n=1 Tax=Ranitomeya imitator TaxID=111125 RepID=A0ABN9LD30_9NEOB|nr:unnamed protein product [Ranitomeya imitator]